MASGVEDSRSGNSSGIAEGYDVHLFVELPPKDLTCTKCEKVLREPHQAECGHLYCGQYFPVCILWGCSAAMCLPQCTPAEHNTTPNNWFLVAVLHFLDRGREAAELYLIQSAIIGSVCVNKNS